MRGVLRLLTLVTVLLLILNVLGCEGEEEATTPTPTAPPTLDVTGTWSGNWWRSDGGEEGTLTATLTQSGSSLSGDMTFTSTTYSYSQDTTISGSVEGNEVVFGMAVGGNGEIVTIDYNGTVSEDGNQMMGTYSMSTGYTGTWSVTAVSLNGEDELAYEANWTPTAEELEQIYCVAATDAAGDVHDYFDATRYPGRTSVTVSGHSEIDLVGAHTRLQGDNVIFWLEVAGDIVDDSWVDYEFTGYTQPDYEGYMSIEYRDGEAEHYISETAEGGYEFVPCEYYKSGGALVIIAPKDAFGSPSVWDFEVSASDGRLWMEEEQGYSDIIFFTE